MGPSSTVPDNSDDHLKEYQANNAVTTPSLAKNLCVHMNALQVEKNATAEARGCEHVGPLRGL